MSRLKPRLQSPVSTHHAGGPPIGVHDEANAIGLDAVPQKEFAYILRSGLERYPFHLKNALTSKPQRQRGLHLFPRHLISGTTKWSGSQMTGTPTNQSQRLPRDLDPHLYEPHVSVPKLVRENLVVLLPDGPASLLWALEVNKGLSVKMDHMS
jgi:hypothetical protein